MNRGIVIFHAGGSIVVSHDLDTGITQDELSAGVRRLLEGFPRYRELEGVLELSRVVKIWNQEIESSPNAVTCMYMVWVGPLTDRVRPLFDELSGYLARIFCETEVGREYFTVDIDGDRA